MCTVLDGGGEGKGDKCILGVGQEGGEMGRGGGVESHTRYERSCACVCVCA